ncbi:HCaRG [Artemisia annua]|uniref:HCaRG n=1 Tax=Artemisia annua TaxID=35608 RepID=A0A2U1QCT9_ARTAN|nr:HCaRG [Artemisia annua]
MTFKVLAISRRGSEKLKKRIELLDDSGFLTCMNNFWAVIINENLKVMEHSLWANLPMLIRANSKELVENILETLWKTRKVGLESADRDVIRDTLQLQNDSDLDPNANRDDIQKLIPAEVSPEIQRLLTLLLQKFHREWREDISKDQLQSNTRPNSEAMDVNFPLAKDRLETMLKSMQRDQQLITTDCMLVSQYVISRAAHRAMPQELTTFPPFSRRYLSTWTWKLCLWQAFCL